METFINLDVSPVTEPILSKSQDISCLRNCFYVDFDFTNIVVSDVETTINKGFLIPCEILCNSTEENHKTALYNIFGCVPPNVLDEILHSVEECARQMVANKDESCDILEMDLWVYVTTRPIN
ncbi:hypothetical protein MtrunA17_Chr5g0415711 [Medicago truncatula]|uniref:Uncharacterized protein n=1 Tax=Medicago truncatula TaxID=3880 RepID=G7K8E7_MEDTR|nr:hypothetical protein MTR_5g037850 [Medicago truncatula]RHN55254.1 hypothetical protein MtrunA17_Chr5g0415711 [Medicago truncatula]